MIARFLATLVLASSTFAAAEPWEDCQFVSYSQPQAFYLSCWGEDGKSMFGKFTYAAIPQSKHPRVVLQVSRTWEGPWKTVARVRADREILESRTGGASRLHVGLGAFAPHLRSHEAGRVVLPTGEIATIRLCKLLHEKRAGGCDE